MYTFYPASTGIHNPMPKSSVLIQNDSTYRSIKFTVTPNAFAIASIVTLLYDSRNWE